MLFETIEMDSLINVVSVDRPDVYTGLAFLFHAILLRATSAEIANGPRNDTNDYLRDKSYINPLREVI